MSSFKLQTTNPDKIEFTLTVTMPLEHWKALRDAMNNNWPAHDFKSRITDMIIQAQKSFYPQEPKP